MENKTNYSPSNRDSSSGANTVLIILLIIIVAAFGYWWYTQQNKVEPLEDDSRINVDVNLPERNPLIDTDVVENP